MNEAVLLSGKLVTAATTGVSLAAVDTVVTPYLPEPLGGLIQYGILGIMCIIFIWVIKAQHSINQKLQDDRIRDIKAMEESRRLDQQTAEKARLTDRDNFFGELRRHFETAVEDRGRMLDLTEQQLTQAKTQTEVTKQLTDKIAELCRQK